jgi:hypothetical protein
MMHVRRLQKAQFACPQIERLAIAKTARTFGKSEAEGIELN